MIYWKSYSRASSMTIWVTDSPRCCRSTRPWTNSNISSEDQKSPGNSCFDTFVIISAQIAMNSWFWIDLAPLTVAFFCFGCFGGFGRACWPSWGGRDIPETPGSDWAIPGTPGKVRCCAAWAAWSCCNCCCCCCAFLAWLALVWDLTVDFSNYVF